MKYQAKERAPDKMWPLIIGNIPDVGRSSASESVERSYAATRTNVETSPVTQAEEGAAARGRRRQNDRRKRQNAPPADKNRGQNVDVEV